MVVMEAVRAAVPMCAQGLAGKQVALENATTAVMEVVEEPHVKLFAQWGVKMGAAMRVADVATIATPHVIVVLHIVMVAAKVIAKMVALGAKTPVAATAFLDAQVVAQKVVLGPVLVDAQEPVKAIARQRAD